MTVGIIEDGTLKGRKIILEPRSGMKDNEYLVEEGTFFNGAPLFTRACLICEQINISDIHSCPPTSDPPA